MSKPEIDEEDFLYSHAPLVEVIAEVRWPIITLRSLAGGAIDPYFESCAPKFQESAAKAGFKHVERLIPEAVPAEMVPRQPIFRFRKGANQWPLFQIGPGIFTCNIVPPYLGWKKEFKPVLDQGLDLLESAFPFQQILRAESFELRYIDAFTDDHGFTTSHAAFLAAALGIQVSFPDQLLNRCNVELESISIALESRLRLKGFPADLVLRFGPGKKEGAEALLSEFRLMSNKDQIAASTLSSKDWMDSAHNMVRTAFDTITTPDLKEKMGPRKPIGG